MAILHGSWRDRESCFFLWGETWRRLETSVSSDEDIADNPFALNGRELQDLLDRLSKTHQLAVTETFQPASQILLLPSQTRKEGDRVPQHSAATPDGELTLHPWRVEGFHLDPAQAVELLHSLPLGQLTESESFVGADLQFWSHVARWTLDLLARGKFLPGLAVRPDGSLESLWQPLLDSATDTDRFHRFAKQMPGSCRAYPDAETGVSPSPQTLLRRFLETFTDTQVRQHTGNVPLPPLNSPVKDWLESLSRPSPRVNLGLKQAEPLATALNTWIAPVSSALSGENQFRTAFQLHPPVENGKDWRFDFYLQAADDPEFLVSADTIWNHAVDRLAVRGREIDRPQETLLSGLGLASRLYPTLEAALQTPRPKGCDLDPIQAYEFLKSTRWRLQENGLGVVLPPNLENVEGLSGRLGLVVRAEPPKKRAKLGLKGLLDFQWQLSLGGKTLSKAEFDRLLTLGSPLVEIDGEWVELRMADVKAANEFFDERQDDLSLSLEDALRIGTGGDTQTLGKLPVVRFEASGHLQALMDTITGKRRLEPLDAPQKFKGELRPYQARGVGWLAFLERWGLGACLADDMGLGKTIQTIAFLQHLQERDDLDAPTLLICPTSVLGNWEREVKKFGPSLSVFVHHGDKRPKGQSFLKTVKQKHLVITSYALVHRDLKDLQKIDWRVVVLDEAQNVKNPDAKQSKAVRQLETQFRVALTGTPVENRLSELWSILDFLNPGYLGTPTFFKRRFAIPIERYGDTDSLQTLRSLVQPFILRRLKTDKDIIQDLPEKQETTVFCSLTAQQARRYQELVEESMAKIESSEGLQRRGLVLGLLTQLKQVCNHPELLGLKNRKNKATILDRMTGGSGKVQRLEELLEESIAEGDRALIFTQFAEWGKVLKAHLEKRLGREVLYLYGATRKVQREAMVDRFQHDPQGPPVFILSLKAGGTGLNLTRANHVFHFDRWWNPAVENQATDRVFRIGQTQNVQVHKFVSTGTLEEKIHDIIESKQALAEQVVGSGESWLTELDTDRLRNLLLLDRSAIVEEDEV
ncbi:DEAD/DEAH box helicase [Baaleninema simplex]|uniref:DEAD/DEAH box helicase n=1 Tax=Baaleninema simplex TaxID=2862350 RepID=UPI00034DD4E6|nr:DEAD/DEAH box helicase [Baaleninema simplex]